MPGNILGSRIWENQVWGRRPEVQFGTYFVELAVIRPKPLSMGSKTFALLSNFLVPSAAMLLPHSPPLPPRTPSSFPTWSFVLGVLSTWSGLPWGGWLFVLRPQFRGHLLQQAISVPCVESHARRPLPTPLPFSLCWVLCSLSSVRRQTAQGLGRASPPLWRLAPSVGQRLACGRCRVMTLKLHLGEDVSETTPVCACSSGEPSVLEVYS